MFLFNLSITFFITILLGYFIKNLKNQLSLENRMEEILIAWFMGLSIVIIIRSIANIGLHYDISSNVGETGLEGSKGKQGYRGEDAQCN